MTDDLFTIKDSAIQNPLFPVIYQEVIFPQPWSGTSQKGDLSSRKRQTFYRWCSRIAEYGNTKQSTPLWGVS